MNTVEQLKSEGFQIMAGADEKLDRYMLMINRRTQAGVVLYSRRDKKTGRVRTSWEVTKEGSSLILEKWWDNQPFTV